MNKVSSTLHKLFYDNKALMMFSVVIAVLIWLIVAISFSPEDTKVIRDVKVNIDLANSTPAQFDLEMFGEKDFTVDVEIKGKRYAINSSNVDESSVKVTAQTAYVDSAGKHTLQLKATKVDENAEFEIVSISEDQVEVFFDVYDEGEFTLTPEIIAEDGIVSDEYVTTSPVLSLNTVTISGPATEISGIAKVVARVEIDKPLTVSETYDAEVIAFDEFGNIFRRITVNYGNSNVTMTIPVYKVVTTDVAVTFRNSPPDYVDKPLTAVITPSSVKAGISTAISENSKSLVLAVIDFKDLKPGRNTFKILADEVPNAVILDESVKEFTVGINVPDVATKKLSVPLENISFINIPEGYTAATASKAISSVIVVGPESAFDKLTDAEIHAEIDLADYIPDENQTSGTHEAKLTVKGRGNCWAYGNYKVGFSLTK